MAIKHQSVVRGLYARGRQYRGLFDGRPDRMALPSRDWRPGFTLMELLVVIVIIGLVSVVALPTILAAYNGRQVSEASRLVQGAIVGARDKALHTAAPSGIRLLPDPAFSGINSSTGLLDPTLPLAYSRIVPLEPAPEYSEGLVTPVTPASKLNITANWPLNAPYPVAVPAFAPNYYPTPRVLNAVGGVLVLLESVVDPNGLPNAPTSWSWNIRVGDKLQLGNSGLWYTVIGPMTIGPAQGNAELFVNMGLPGDASAWPKVDNLPTECLFLVNGRDDNGNGWVDEGWDGVDNDSATLPNGQPNPGSGYVDDTHEWETEVWGGSLPNQSPSNLPYTIRRRPAPSVNARTITLPAGVVIDASTWGGTQERSRVPASAFNRFAGYIDLMVNPDGSVLPTTVYSSPSSFSMASSFVHLWLADRRDVVPPSPTVTSAPFLPVAKGIFPGRFPAELEHDYGLVCLFARTGRISTASEMAFLFDQIEGGYTNTVRVGANAMAEYSPNYPFIPVQQGAVSVP